MKTTVHVQRDPAEHYQVLLKHRSGQPKVLHDLTVKKGKVRSDPEVFFGRYHPRQPNQGISLRLYDADREDLRMAIDFLTALRDNLVLGGLPFLARVSYQTKDGKTEWKRMQDLSTVEMAKMVVALDEQEKAMQAVAAKRKEDEERALHDEIDAGLADVKAGRILGPFKGGKELRAGIAAASDGDTVLVLNEAGETTPKLSKAGKRKGPKRPMKRRAKKPAKK